MTDQRWQELRRDIAARRKVAKKYSQSYDLLLSWLDEQQGTHPEELALVELVLSCRGRSQPEGFEAVAKQLKGPIPGVPLSARLELLRRRLDLHETFESVGAHVLTLRSEGSPARERLLQSLAKPSERPGLQHVHSLLVPAMRALPLEALHPAPHHRGEPTPTIGARGYVRYMLFLARQVEHTLASADRDAFEAALEAASAHTTKARPPESDALKAAIKLKPKSLAMIAARSAAVEGGASSRRPDGIGRSALNATTRILEQTLADHGPGATSRLLSKLDDELRRLDIQYAFEERDKVPSRPVARAVYRGGTVDDDGIPVTVLWLAELANGALALLAKVKSRFALVEGPRDEVLAAIPDEHFERAVRAMT